MIKLMCGDCSEIMNSSEFKSLIQNRIPVIVTDPPFNIGYHYKNYKDKLKVDEYYSLVGGVLQKYPCVVIHYPEPLYRLAFKMGRFPDRIVSWVYNSNTPRQHRDIAFFDIMPVFSQVTQPYKNLKDKRIQERIARGYTGAKIYDWWNVNQVKNVSKDKTNHPCQMPQEVMNNIIGILPKSENLIVIDPFMGSGTTGVACKKYDVDFIGIDLDEEYCKIAKERLAD